MQSSLETGPFCTSWAAVSWLPLFHTLASPSREPVLSMVDPGAQSRERPGEEAASARGEVGESIPRGEKVLAELGEGHWETPRGLHSVAEGSLRPEVGLIHLLNRSDQTGCGPRTRYVST